MLGRGDFVGRFEMRRQVVDRSDGGRVEREVGVLEVAGMMGGDERKRLRRKE